MSIFFTSDTHFGHANILKYDKTREKKFFSLQEHDEYIIQEWNKKVRPTDEVYHLGDFQFRSGGYLERLNGVIHLIVGNHDHRTSKRGFNTVQDVLYLDKLNLFLSHYPHFSWPCSHHGCIHLFGHVHENFQHVPGCKEKNLNVGVMWTDFKPITYEEVLSNF